MNALRALVLIPLLLAASPGALCTEQSNSSNDRTLLEQAAAERDAGRYTKAAELYTQAIVADPKDPAPRLELINMLAQVSGKEKQCSEAVRAAIEAGVFSKEQWTVVIGLCTEWGFEKEAADVYRMLLAQDPDNAEYPVKIVELTLASTDDADAVRAEIEKLLGDKPPPELALAMAAICETHLRFEEAAWLYQKILEGDPKHLEARLRLARVALRWGKLDEAAAYARANIELDYEHLPSRLLLAEVELRRGNYEQAGEIFGTIAKEEGGHFEASVGEAQADFAIGRTDEAVSACLKAIRLEADVAPEQRALAHALLADIYFYTGRYDKAGEQYRLALEADPTSLEAMIGAARALADSGKAAEAERAFYRLYDVYESATSDEELTARVLTHVGIACRYTDNPQDALECFVEASKKDATYIPARLWLGRLFLERHQPRDAAKEFAEILAINPRHTGALVGLAEVALDDSRFDEVQARCEQALAVNPHDVETLNLLAEMRILDEQYPAAEDALDRSLAVNPNSLETLAHLASYYEQVGDEAAFRETEARVLAINPKYARLYEIVASACEFRRQNETALELLRKGIALDERYAPVWTSLGVILMREGREAEAEDALATAFKLDSYDHRTLNFTNVLKEIRQGYVVRETEHFIMKWDEQKDFVLAHFVPDFCEGAYRRVCDHFEFEPPQKTLIEVFPEHELFAARISGMPFIATVGACFGKVFAMDSPRGGGFDWHRVFEHEFTHVVTLQQTKMRIPFWFTEGIATAWEKGPKPVAWDRMKVRAAVLDEVVPLDDLSSWFTRARSMDQRQWAYAQAMLTTQYLYREFGREKVVAMLGLYRDGKTTREVIETVCGIPQAEFERRVKADIIAQARGLRVPPLFILDDAERFKARLDAAPDDAVAHARYAQAMVQRAAAAPEPAASGFADEARTHAQRAIELDTTTPEPYMVLAFLALRAGNTPEAGRWCNEALARDSENYSANAMLGDIAAQARRWDEAVRCYKAAEQTYAGDAQIGAKLARIYEDRGDLDLAVAELEHVTRVEPQPYAALRELGRLYEQQHDWKNVVRVLEQALEFNLYDPEVYELLGRAYAERDEDALAADRRAVGADVAYLAATSTYKKSEVRHYLKLALGMNPKHEAALKLAEQIGGLEGETPEEPETPEKPAEDTGASGADAGDINY
jgi:tetratricopeptide (TPR) repeat protein